MSKVSNRIIYIILDGWSVHKSYAVRMFAALNPRLHLVPLPSCSSWMNAIERIFSRVQVEVLDNNDFQYTLMHPRRDASEFDSERGDGRFLLPKVIVFQ